MNAIIRRCRCSHLEAVHELAARGRRSVRGACSGCRCTRFEAASTVESCPTCGAAFSVYEQQRRADA